MDPSRRQDFMAKFGLAWAIVATLLSLVSLGVALSSLRQARGRDHRLAGWSRWEKSTGGNGHWYKAVLLPAGVTWTQTEVLARQDGGYLATILSEAENRFVFSLIDAPEFFTADHGSGPALGGFQQDGAPEPDGGWCWLSGAQWNYSNWMRTEPNNGSSRFGTEDRLQYYSGLGRTPAATWNDINRGDKSSPIFSYVAERD